ncbi:MAG: enoyl-ACP reductase FabI [Bdellovibrionales bacterium]
MSKNMKGLIIGVANDQSIASGCARILYADRAEIALTYLNDKAKPYVEPIAKAVNAPILMPLDVCNPQQFDALFAAIKEKWGKLDFLIHSVAFAPINDLHGRVTDCSLEGFAKALDISCHSFIRCCKAAEPLMVDGGSIMAMTYYGSEKVIPNYNMMGVVKAALEVAVRYIAAELGPKSIRVNAISPGPIMTRAASGITQFDEMIKQAAEKAPIKEPLTIEHVGELAAFLVSEKSRLITGQIIHIDGGYSITG